MSDDKPNPLDTVNFTTEGKLRHENQFLKERVANLENFKKNFFAQHYELIDAKDKIHQLEEQLSLDKIKQQISVSETPGQPDSHKKSSDILEYFHSALTASSLQDLVMSLFQSAEGIASEILVQIRDDGNILNFCLDENIKSESLALLKTHGNREGTAKFGKKTILNYKHLSIIYSLDPDNTEMTETQLDEFMDIISLGANTRTSTLKQRLELNTLRENIYKIFKKMNQSFDTLQADLEANILNISKIYSELITNLTHNLEMMQINQQHRSLIDIILNDTKSELLLALTASMTLDKDFLSVLKKLENAYASAHEKHIK